ncbi:sigma-54-dependent Fis family transcriptional regulator [Alkalicoccus daliensis]|uniref:Transcriptional regulator of acetoin/glycerol metabolism n=1 Tax=Alkalicoccus daliensis TaxID=745820 RepID=A0A1H0KKD6_9BACI|nr:sigma-54-dependent Fis family transcriptional regulator [Alkalicoccus daliensis]SDO56355.1 Transcriptional regulator of acetoin/glycerol metabolism [Alkalicoccus daliensis]
MEQSLIEESRKRCQESGLEPTGPIRFQPLTKQQLKKLLEKNKDLVRHVQPIFSHLHTLINKDHFVAVVIDADGYVLSRAGGIGSREADECLDVGTNWSEKNMGTNAMGIVLQEKQPVVIHGEHHYYQKHHFLACAASPVYAPDGTFCGAVNISTKRENYHPLLLSLTSTIAASVQSNMKLDKAEEEETLLEKELEILADLTAQPLITLAQENQIIRANAHAKKMFGKEMIGKNWRADWGGDRYFYPVQTGTRTLLLLKQKTSRQQLYTFNDLKGSCLKLKQIKKLGARAAAFEYPLMIGGESGTGKELLAQAVHAASERREQPFIALNCNALPENLMESELFGYEKGSFTGAHQQGKAGKFEAAEGGTVFLDEVADLSLKAQGALLRVLQEKMVVRIGGVKVIPLDVRIISATNKDLRQEVNQGRFREDLYFRLKGISITMPPLRERADLLELADVMLEKLVEGSAELSPEAKAKLLTYAWPGNVRELQSVLMQAYFISETQRIPGEAVQFEQGAAEKTGFNIRTIEALEEEAIRNALHQLQGNVSQAAERLGLGRNTIYAKMKKYNIRI